ncbi:hypothetical protein BAE44_0001310 [Dichanthelium oligosanthes]|uniref:Uncharacterized protein n=1 Tax=Dichanthelium oligosanthes TaxID=888268 RepID=A0A1E5WJT2_9POAL|nr:hypothetical protein BAE44_0001310 [Dichanthelium oligosanthes]
MAKQQQQQALPLCTVFLVALLVVSAMHAVPAEAGRALLAGSIGYEPLNPGRTPYAGRGEPYTRPCRYKNECEPPATATP